ncbi:MAG TPA: hypothetical protein VEC96_09695 [Anaerolineae bacterium]|nr:hypothetical protein [Anaerolineae bacterium]
MSDLWQGLFWRLQSIANNKQNGGCEGVALIELELFFTPQGLAGWSKPDRIPLEPKQFDTTIFNLAPVKDWNGVIACLRRESGGRIKRVLVVRDGRPVGLFKEVIEPAALAA